MDPEVLHWNGVNYVPKAAYDAIGNEIRRLESALREISQPWSEATHSNALEAWEYWKSEAICSRLRARTALAQKVVVNADGSVSS